MKLGSTVENRNFSDAAYAWIVANGHRLAATVCAASVLTAITVVWIAPWLLSGPWLGPATTAHANWLDARPIPGGQVLDTKGYLAGLRKLGPIPHLPDLSATGLTIRRVSHVAGGDDRPNAIHVGYAEPDGCRVSLWITPTVETDVGKLEEYHRGDAFSWHAHRLRYVLVGSDMRYERFFLLAKIARETTAARKGPAGPAQFALAMSAMTGPICES